jgi:hypothetical protein
MKIHGHPQKTDYKDDGSDFPVPEAQGWWPLFDPIQSGHLHVAVGYPLYGEITSLEPFWVPFTLKLHNIAGTIGMFFGKHAKSIVWDATGSEQMPVMRGENPGLFVWTGKILIDYTLGLQPWIGEVLIQRGWSSSQFTARVALDNKDLLEVQLVTSQYMLLDPNAPETPASQQGRPGVVVSSRVTVMNTADPKTAENSMTLGGNQFGVMVTELNDYIPLAPITAPWPTILNVYDYTSPFPERLSNGTFRQLIDANLHGTPPNIPPNEGILLESGTAGVQGFANRVVTFDPAVMGPGAHRGIVNWTQEANGEVIASVLAFNVPVGTGVPVPTTCQDKAALNFGGLLPCQYLEIPPPNEPMPMPVPNVVGMTKDAASAALITGGFVLGAVTSMASDTVASGQVISQTPAANTTAMMGSAVAVMVSTGTVVVDPPAGEVWEMRQPVFMQLKVNGVFVDRWKICDPDEPMMPDGGNCPEVVTK